MDKKWPWAILLHLQNSYRNKIYSKINQIKHCSSINFKQNMVAKVHSDKQNNIFKLSISQYNLISAPINYSTIQAYQSYLTNMYSLL